MGLTGKPRNELNLFDLDIKLTMVQLKALKVFPYHTIPQSEVLAWCRKHGFGRDKSIASLTLLERIGLIYRDYKKHGPTLFDAPIKNHKPIHVGYKISYFGEDFFTFFVKMGIPEGSILAWGGVSDEK